MEPKNQEKGVRLQGSNDNQPEDQPEDQELQQPGNEKKVEDPSEENPLMTKKEYEEFVVDFKDRISRKTRDGKNVYISVSYNSDFACSLHIVFQELSAVKTLETLQLEFARCETLFSMTPQLEHFRTENFQQLRYFKLNFQCGWLNAPLGPLFRKISDLVALEEMELIFFQCPQLPAIEITEFDIARLTKLRRIVLFFNWSDKITPKEINDVTNCVASSNSLEDITLRWCETQLNDENLRLMGEKLSGMEKVSNLVIDTAGCEFVSRKKKVKGEQEKRLKLEDELQSAFKAGGFGGKGFDEYGLGMFDKKIKK